MIQPGRPRVLFTLHDLARDRMLMDHIFASHNFRSSTIVSSIPQSLHKISLLIKGGRALTFNPNKSISFPRKDILIDDNRISKIELSIDFEIVSPGFVDSRRHFWQFQLCTRTANVTFLGYLGEILPERATF